MTLAYPPIVPGDMSLIGTAAGKPAAGIAGRIYFETDTGIVQRDSGAAWVPVTPYQAAGFAPTADGSLGYDTTRKTLVAGGAGSLAGSIGRVLSRQFSTTDQLVAATINTTETAFATTFTFPANYFIANRVVRMWALFERFNTATVPTLLPRMRLQSAGPTNVNLYVGNALAPGAGASSVLLVGLLQGTGAPGASVNIECAMGASNNGNIYTANSVAQGVAVATNAQQVLQFTWQFGSNAAGNTINLRQLIIEEMA